jgi:hypothetical protein
MLAARTRSFGVDAGCVTGAALTSWWQPNDTLETAAL